MQIRPPAPPRCAHRATPGTHAGRRPRPTTVLALVATGLILLAACSTIRVFTDFGEVLRDAGFGNVSVTIDSRGAGVLIVSASAPAGDSLDEAHDRAAELVWHRFPRRFEGVRITLDGERRDHTRDELQESYGPRAASLDETDLTDEVTRFGMTALVAVLIAGLVVAIAVTLTAVVLVRAGRRRRQNGGGTSPPGSPVPWAPPGAGGSPAPWMPPGGHAPGPGGPSTPTPPPAGWAPPPTDWSPPPPGDHRGPEGPTPTPTPGTTPTPAEDRKAARHLGRRPRGPVPPTEQIPPGWGR